MDGAGRIDAQSRDAALEAVLMRFAKAVRHRLRTHDLRRLGIDEEDVEQDVRIRLWTTLQRDPSLEPSAAYVQRVVLSAIIDAVRRARTLRRDLSHDLQGVEATQPDQGRSPDMHLAQFQWLDLVDGCIARLPARRQAPVRLHLLGYSMQELSELNGLTLDAGSKLVRRGLADLRSLLAQLKDTV